MSQSYGMKFIHRFFNVSWIALAWISSATFTYSADWQTLSVPGNWAQAFPDSSISTATGWYRCWVKVPDSYFSRHERNLFEESVGMHIRGLVGNHALWVNGTKVGSGQVSTPENKESTNTTFRHKIPAGTLEKGKWNELTLRLQAPASLGGFLGESPFIMDYFLECVFEGEWEFLKEDTYVPGPAIDVQPQRAAFDQFRESQRVLARTEQVHGPRLAPHESAARMTASEGLETELLLYEPTVTQPFHFTFDERGRMWVAQSRQYPYPAGIEMLSRDKYYRSHYNAIPPAPPNHTPGADRITIHEDTNGDGTYDTHKTFVDGLNMANSAIRGHGGVWIMHTPHLLFYPDANNDDIPDGDPEVHLTGFGFEDSHSISNGLVWGPDGWLYGGQGSTCSCRVTRPGIDAKGATGVYFEGCMVWRYHPETRAFELFAEGGGNTYGLEFDAEGRLYSGHNGGSTRGWHFVQGGFYQMQGVNPGKFGPPRNPYAFGELPMMATPDRVVRFTHFGAFAEGSAIPPQWHGMLFAIDPLHNEVIASHREERGATFRTKDQGVVVKSFDPAFRPVHIANAPDGSIMVSDMYEFYIAHGQHYQNQIDPTTGRIFRIAGKDLPRESDLNLAAKSDSELMDLLGHPNKWHRQTAVRLLGERRSPSTFQTLRRKIIDSTGPTAWNALWALYQAGGLDSGTAIQALQHSEAAVRNWAVRFIGDTYGIHRNLGLPGKRLKALPLPDALMKALMDQARIENNPETRSQMASTARRLELAQGLSLIKVIMHHDEDLEDPFIPLLSWWVLEAHIPENIQSIVRSFMTKDLWRQPIIRKQVLPRLARRLAVDGKRQDLVLLANLLAFADTEEQTDALLQGYEQAFRGRTIPVIPDELALELAQATSRSLVLRLRQGEDAAFEEAAVIIASEEQALEDRLLYTRTLGEARRTSNLSVLLNLAKSKAPPELRKAAFASLSAYTSESIADAILEFLPDIPDDVRLAALNLLANRPRWTEKLFENIESGALSVSFIPNEIADLFRSHANQSIRDRAAEMFPLKQSGSEQTIPIKQSHIQTILQGGSGDPYKGEPIFLERCGVCHKLFFKGGQVGPDLTAYQRKDLGTLLTSILDPNAEIREGYQYVNIETKDGRSLAGFQVDRDNQVTVLRGLDGQDVTLPNTEIESMEPNSRSLMPEGLLNDLSDQQLRDFFAYLRISQPIRN
ncbi:MAG: PVC-type heme-binding CxxCH protein [Verrucomicrobiota bacterium]